VNCPFGGIQLGGSLMVTFTVPMPETMLVEEPPLQLTRIAATANSATAPSRNTPAPEFRAIQSDFIALLLFKKNFQVTDLPEGDSGTG